MLHQHTAWEARHVHREANAAAHTMAQRGKTGGNDQMWVEECPSFVRNDIIKDNACNQVSE